MTVLPGERSQELEGPLDEVLVELEHPAVPGVGVDDELAVRESPVEVDGVLGGHHLVALAVHDEHRLVDAREVRGLLLTPPVDGTRWWRSDRRCASGIRLCAQSPIARHRRKTAEPFIRRWRTRPLRTSTPTGERGTARSRQRNRTRTWQPSSSTPPPERRC